MSVTADPLTVRGAEAAAKLALLREALAQLGAGAIRLRGEDWFAWATAGGMPLAPDGCESGVAELLVTPDEACVLTDEAEAERLRLEEVPAGFTFHGAPWTDAELHETYVLGTAGGRPVLSDRPGPNEQPLPAGLKLRRMVLGFEEQERYRQLGREAAEAIGEALRAARPDWTEYQLAGEGARALLRRGIQPSLVLAAGERRLGKWRRPTPSHEPLGARATLSCCARRHGLVARLSRSASFGGLPAEQDELLRLESTGLDAVRAGQSLAAVYHAFEAAYRHANRPDAIRERPQGGIVGYQACELVASPSTATGLETGMAFAFNPGFDGIGIEDTFLLGATGLENLTLDPQWPAVNIGGRMRPRWLELT
ncbi:peptidase M24 [Massilia sp. WF1]|uniref:M24 family metallopeptidase n=1 Tax=unclassified Massilia TaxID=2609279 RepID=UPI00068A3E1D|nr:MULTISPECIES: M24 family metallopeptidase [unclassified Massilia]ALK96127.1 peptidase M24 [Massilia sp. WG5]KNZ67296.1 peptidase M24 [Massilia sp. WF1]